MTEIPPPQSSTQAVQYEEVYVEVPTWPRAIGIFSIIWASLGLCCMAYGIYQMVVPQTDPNMPADLTEQLHKQQHSVASYVSYGVGTVAVFTLIAAGILTLMRNIMGRYLHLIYGVLSITNFAIAAVGLFATIKIFQDWGAQNPGSDFAKAINSGVVTGFLYGIIAVSGLISCIYPLFLFVWFGLIKRTKQSMTGIPDHVDPSMTGPV